MTTAPTSFRLRLLAPDHWPAWIGLGLLWLLSRIPYRALMMLGGGLGWVFARIPGSRRRIARRNIERCFPQLDANARERLLEDNLRDAGRMLAEFALAWLGSKRAIARVPVHIEGLEHVAAQSRQAAGCY